MLSYRYVSVSHRYVLVEAVPDALYTDGITRPMQAVDWALGLAVHLSSMLGVA